MMRRPVGLSLLGVAAGLLVACGGSGSTTTTTRTVGPRPLEIRVTTNVPELNQALNTALSADAIEMARLTGYQRVPCSAQASGPSPPPVCRGDEPEGTPVEVFGVVTCEGNTTWVRPEDVPDSYKFALGSSDIQLAAVYAPRPAATRFDAQYIAVITSGTRGVGVYFHSGRIVALEDDCGDVARLLAPDRVASYVVPPTAVAGTPASTP